MADLLDAAGLIQPVTHTERQMLDALHVRYSQITPNSARRYAVAEHVRSSCGFSGWPVQIRTVDFMAQDTWEGQGLKLHGHEVKVSRSDWLTELKDPSKSEAVRRFCDHWWLVAPSKALVRDDLPDGWGLIVLDRAGRLRVAKSAPRLDPEPHPVTFRASLMRAVAKTAERRVGHG